MEIKKNIIIELSENDVKEIIVDYLKEKGYPVSSDNITFSIKSRLEGYSLVEHSVNYFEGAYIKYKEK